MATALHAALVRTRSNVNLWKIPLLLSLASVGLFGLTMIPDTLDAYGVIHLPVWLTMGGIDDARAILSAMLGCVSTVLALIFSVALLVLSMVATLFGPRLLYRFLRDWVTQATIGLFMATFVYLCLVFLVTHQDEHTRLVPQVSLITAWLLVVTSFGFLVVYSHRIAASIQNPDLVARLVDDIRPELVGPDRGGGAAESADVVGEQLTQGAAVPCSESGYVQEIDHGRLVAAARDAGVVVHVLFRPGQFVLRGETLARVWPPERAAGLSSRVEDHVRLGRHRTIRQDAEFGVAQMVEMPDASNQTPSEAAASDGVWFDASGKTRVRVRPVKLERLVRLGFDQIRQSSADNPAVLIRILDTIRRLIPRVGDEAARAALVLEADAVRETAAHRVACSLDKKEVEAAWERTKAG
jgi:uncharacterized membrane protein